MIINFLPEENYFSFKLICELSNMQYDDHDIYIILENNVYYALLTDSNKIESINNAIIFPSHICDSTFHTNHIINFCTDNDSLKEQVINYINQIRGVTNCIKETSSKKEVNNDNK